MSTNFNNQNKKQLPIELKAFNWGAFLLTFIWGIRFKAWITLLAIPLIWFQLPLGLNWILFFILQIYCGLKGNEWAYQVDWWKNTSEFQKTQINWAAAAVAINIVIPFVILLIAARFIQKTPDNPAIFIENAQCTISYNKIKQGLPKIKITRSMSTTDMAKLFASEFSNTKTDGSSVIFTVNDGANQIDLYSINFNKYDTDVNCDINLENCTITSSYIMPNLSYASRECTFYFDSNGKIKPDKRTQQALNMGMNIFKYL